MLTHTGHVLRCDGRCIGGSEEERENGKKGFPPGYCFDPTTFLYYWQSPQRDVLGCNIPLVRNHGRDIAVPKFPIAQARRPPKVLSTTKDGPRALQYCN